MLCVFVGLFVYLLLARVSRRPFLCWLRLPGTSSCPGHTWPTFPPRRTHIGRNSAFHLSCSIGAECFCWRSGHQRRLCITRHFRIPAGVEQMASPVCPGRCVTFKGSPFPMLDACRLTLSRVHPEIAALLQQQVDPSLMQPVCAQHR